MVILEHEYEKDNPKNEQMRYIIATTWDHYLDFLNDSMDGRELVITENNQNKNLIAEFKFKALSAWFIHEATVTDKTSFYNDIVKII